MNHDRLKLIQEILNMHFYDRKEEVEALMVALLSKQHILFIGPAGTGKSELSSMLGKMVSGSKYFQHLLTPYSTPEELFGVLSLKDLEQGIYKRNTTDMLPEVHFSFIDEIFKANSSILNSLLTLVNERLYYNHGVPVKVPLMTIVGSSNEYIEEGEGLEALFDRFLLRFEVDYIRGQESFISMLKNEEEISLPTLSLDELHFHQQQVEAVFIPDTIYQLLSKIRIALKDEGIRPSDRRFKQSLSLLKAKAYLNGQQVAQREDVYLLKNVLWEKPDDRTKTKEILGEIIQDTVEDFIIKFSNEFEILLHDIQHTMLSNEGNARNTLSDLLLQGKSMYLEVQTMSQQLPKRKELEALKNDMHHRLLEMTTEVIGF